MGLETSLEKFPQFDRVIIICRWQKFCKNPGWSISPVVRDFYANVYEHERNQMNMRGKVITFDSHAINHFYELLDIEDDAYQ
ncbi:hypothetical protein PanWU01x14_127910 [Parasponia andersonii]|uniref:Uncharacterized protein n=1 Tax=Parasponia andersonii TaxID=3476 RepID=A0A2P5CSJ6_PARAD|nr:hypothetical protein PanWU01x14_127910 [Parasponia andersonii]